MVLYWAHVDPCKALRGYVGATRHEVVACRIRDTYYIADQQVLRNDHRISMNFNFEVVTGSRDACGFVAAAELQFRSCSAQEI